MANKVKETSKDQKGTFHYEPVVWGDWKEGDVVVFEGYLSKTYYDYTLGESYTVGWEGGDLGPLDNDGYTPPTHWDNKSVFKFSRKVYDVIENVDNIDVKVEDKKWYETHYAFPPINSVVLAEYNAVKDEYFKVKILAHDTDGKGVLLMWLEGPSASITQKRYNASYFKPLPTVENKESEEGSHECDVHILTLDEAILHAEDKSEELRVKNQILCADNHKILANWLIDYRSKLQEENINQKGTKSLDNLLKELHNLKQEEKELSAKVNNILKEINSVVGLYGLSILFTNEYVTRK